MHAKESSRGRKQPWPMEAGEDVILLTNQTGRAFRPENCKGCRLVIYGYRDCMGTLELII